MSEDSTYQKLRRELRVAKLEVEILKSRRHARERRDAHQLAPSR